MMICEQVAQQLIWFSEQLMPRVLKTSWLERGPDGRDSPADEWLAECHRCTEHADVRSTHCTDVVCVRHAWLCGLIGIRPHQ